MKRITLTLWALIGVLVASADEGMWLPSLIGNRIDDMRAKGFRLTAEDIYSVNQASMKDAVVLFNGGCTGEIVSEEGLLLTNHHCGYGAIQAHSTVEHDYLTYGFWARNREEELPNQKLQVRILVRMEDVTDRIQSGEKAEEIIRAVRKEGKGYRATVEQMYYGTQQFLFVYEQFDDVRLVGAPPSSIGKFGGDTDNWIWPRHTGDFSLFRIYADKENKPAPYSPDNVPYRPKRHFAISTKGVQEGDFTMIYGFPGNTQEYVLPEVINYIVQRSDPAKIAIRTGRLNIISAAQESDPALRIHYAAKHATIANAWKKWQGEVLGLTRNHSAERRAQYYQDFLSWCSDHPESGYPWGEAAAREVARIEDAYFAREILNETLGTLPARYTADERAEDCFARREQTERKLFHLAFKEYGRCPNSWRIPRYDESYASHNQQEAAEYVDRLFEGVWSGTDTMEMYRLRKDLKRMRDHIEWYLGMSGRGLRNVTSKRLNEMMADLVSALRKWDTNRAFYPDANLTLRVAYGKIAGYEYADGEYHIPQTTLEGIMAKDNPDIYDYDIPQRLRDLYAAKDYGRWGVKIDGKQTVPVCFLATNHTTGGNSGSPVLNGRGELIGINFDRTWRSTMSDYDFDPSICRNIAVDIRYVLFVIDRVGEAGHLIQEMTLK